MKANRLTQYDYDTYAPIESIQHWNFVLCIYFLRYNTQYVQIAIFVHLKSIFRISWIRSPTAFATNKTYICILVISRWKKKNAKKRRNHTYWLWTIRGHCKFTDNIPHQRYLSFFVHTHTYISDIREYTFC